MSAAVAKGNLIVLVPCKDWERTISALLSHRTRDLGCRSVPFSVVVHSNHDPGVYRQAAGILRPYIRDFGHALVVLDEEWDGSPGVDAIRSAVQQSLDRNGWLDRSAVIVVRPELEVWVWSGSTDLPSVLGWGKGYLFARLKDWGFERDPHGKPLRPKEALCKVLYELQRPASSAIFARLAAELPLEGCRDPAFQEFRKVLKEWFPRRGRASE